MAGWLTGSGGRYLSRELRGTCPDPMHHFLDRFLPDGLLQFAFPDDDEIPSSLDDVPGISGITGDVGNELALPEFAVRRRHGGEAASGMTMPEAAMHHDCRPVFRQHDVRMTGEVLGVKSESEACSVQGASKDKFRLGILAAYARHHSGAGRLVHDVGHPVSLLARCLNKADF